MRLNLVTSILAFAALIAVLLAFRHDAWTPLRFVGLAVTMIATALLLLARYELGRSFAITAKAQTLVTTGLYSRVRNPIYASGMLFFCGLALYTRSWWPLALMFAALPLQIVRARREAEVLHAAFGAEYERYRLSTWF